MNRVQELILSGEEPCPEDSGTLTGLVESHPWFVYGRYLLMSLYRREGNNEALNRQKSILSARLVYYPLPPFLLDNVDGTELRRFGRMNIIEDFLASESHKIVVDRKKAEEATDISQNSIAEGDDDMITETLARVYMDQGLTEKAMNIYHKLSLKFPEKSVYFAAIIDELEKQKNNNHV